MNIGIIGGGSIGLLVSGFLSTEHNITLYVRRNQQKKSINNYGLSVTGFSAPCSVKALLTDELKNEDCYIICVKQAHIPTVISLIHNSAIHTPLIFLQNGMGHIDYIKDMLLPVYMGVVEHGALRKNDYTVAHTGKGKIKLASFNVTRFELDTIISQLNAAKFVFEPVENWHQMLCEKLIVNAVINPLTAMFNVSNGEVLYNPHIHSLARELCKEASITLELDFTEQWNRVQTVASTTKNNVSSMLKDIRENRQTEIEAISGYLLKESKHHIPYTSFVYDSIRALETKKGNYI